MWEIISTFISSTILLISGIIFGIIIQKDKVKVTFKKNIILFQLICVLQTIIFLNFNGTLKTLIILLIYTVYFKYMFKTSIFKMIFILFLYIIILIIPDVLTLLIMTNIFGMSKEYYYDSFAGSIIANMITSILLIIFTFILKKPLRKIVDTEINYNIKIIILSAITLIPILLFFYTLVNEFKFNNNIMQYLIAMIVVIAILFTLIKQTIENGKISKEYDELLKYMTTFENEIEKQRILRHETKNEFLTVRAKICDKQETKEIIGYIDEILKEKIKVKQEEYAKFGYLPPNGIKGLCYFKVQEAEEKNIKVALNISKRIKNSTIYDLDTKQQKDFARILGVILDNAIEASEVSHKKQIGIEAYMNTNKEFKMIISNTYNNSIDKRKIGNEKISTKGKNRGHGLLLVKHIISKNKILKLKTEIRNHIYVQTIIVKKV